MTKQAIFAISIIFLLLMTSIVSAPAAFSAKKPKDWEAHPPIHIKKSGTLSPTGLFPTQILHAYGFDKLSCYGTASCGAGQTIAIVDAYDAPNIASDLNTYDTQFGLPACTTANGCFTKATPQGLPIGNTGWALEESLDVEWAHTVAPGAKIILVESNNNLISSLLGAVDYAVSQPNVHQVSMSWGGGDSVDDSIYDSHFNVAGVSFTASAGDSGTGALYPAASPYIVSVGGTTLNVDTSGNVQSETAWSGSGGGVSSFESKPTYQNGFDSHTGRGVPDVSYDADPNTGVPVYDSYGYGWVQLGGTSVGAPQWAAAISIANAQRSTPFSASSFDANTNLYSAAGGTSYNLGNIYFRDITSGTNGGCGSVCTAVQGYDFITGLGSPLSNNLISYLAPSIEDFAVSSFPTSVILQQGTGGGSTITVASLGGFSSAVGLTVSSPAGLTALLSQSSVTPPSGGSATSSLSIAVPSTTPTGTYTVTVTGSSGTLSHYTTVQVMVTSPHSTSTAVTPNPTSAVLGGTKKFYATITDTSSTPTTPTGTVSWSDGGAGGKFSSASCTLASSSSSVGTCNVVYSTPSSAGPVTITGTYSGDSTHKTSPGTSALTVTLRHSSTAVTPNPSSTVHGSTITYLATVTDTSGGTKSAPTGTASWSSSLSGGSFGSTTCTLVPISSSQSQCSATYTAPPSAGPLTITAKYGGDAKHKTSSGTSSLTVS